MNPAKTIVPPWTPATVDQLNAFQTAGRMHPFTCGARHDGPRPVLVATTDGWVCPDTECVYTQTWAHSFMTDPRLTQPFRL